MRFFLPKPITIVDSNIGDNVDENGATYSVHSKLIGYNLGSVVKYEQNVYTALTTIYPLAHYIWEDLIVASKYAYDLHNEIVVATPTAVPIVSGVTVVYVRSQNSYYMAKTTGIVDFTTEDILTPAHFDKITGVVPYRIDLAYPSGTSNTLFWSYTSVANKFRVFDNAVGTQTIFDTLVYYKFGVSASSGVAFLNVEALTLRVKMTDTITLEVLYDVTTVMKDTSALTDYEKVCTIPPIDLRNYFVMLPARYSQSLEVWISNASGQNAKVGAIKAGLVDYLGQTLDNVEFDNKSYNSVTQRPNGEYIWNESNSDANKVFDIRYNIKIDSATFDIMINKAKDITDKEVVLIGDDTDTLLFRTLINYGAIKRSSGALTTNSTTSNLSIGIENFI